MNNFFVEFFVDFFFLKILEKKGRKFKTLNPMFCFFCVHPPPKKKGSLKERKTVYEYKNYYTLFLLLFTPLAATTNKSFDDFTRGNHRNHRRRRRDALASFDSL